MNSNTKLLFKALSRFVPGFFIIAGILCISAGTLKFWNAWLFIIVLFIPMIFVLFYLIKNDPDYSIKDLVPGKRKNRKSW